MNRFTLKKLILLIFVYCSISFFGKAFAADAADAAADLGGPITLEQTQLSQVLFKSVVAMAGTAEKSDILLSARVSEEVRAALISHIRNELGRNGQHQWAVDSLASQASVRIENVGGTPVAFVIGKQSVSFGNRQWKSPHFDADPVAAANSQSDVIGFTVVLGDLGLFDLIEASVFETSAGDLEIGAIDGASIRLTKEISENWKVVASAIHQGKGLVQDDNRESIGFIFNDGTWTIWAEGVHMSGNSAFPDAEWALTVGFEKKINNRERVVVSLSYIESALTRVAIAYEIRFAKNLNFSPEIAYVTRPDGSGEMQYFARTTLRFQPN